MVIEGNFREKDNSFGDPLGLGLYMVDLMRGTRELALSKSRPFGLEFFFFQAMLFRAGYVSLYKLYIVSYKYVT